MPKAYEAWTVLPHSPLEALAANVWRVEGSLDGMPLKRVMTIAKRADGSLVLHNPIALDEPTMAQLEALGPVSTLLVPNGYHRLDSKVFQQRYPAAKLYCPRGARARVAEVVRVDGTYDEFPGDANVELFQFDGTGEAEGGMLVRSGPDDTTLVVNDVVFNMPHVGGMQGWVLKNITQSTGGPRVSRVARMFIIKDKGAAAAHLRRLAVVPKLKRVIVSHHETITSDAGRTLLAVADSLG